MNIAETIASGALGGLLVWSAMRAWRAFRGFTGRYVADTVPFARAEDTLAHDRCEPIAPRPGVEAFRDYVIRQWGGRDLGIWRECGRGGSSEHKIGQAWDWGIKVPSDASQSFLDWLGEPSGWRTARDLGVAIVIADRRIWTAWIDGPGRLIRSYKGPDPHNTHIHVSFSREGAMGKTPGYGRIVS
jgi:hypothetical protein